MIGTALRLAVLDTGAVAVLPPVPPVTLGRIPISMVDYSGAGTYPSGFAACQQFAQQAARIMGLPLTGFWAAGMAEIALRETAYNSPMWQVNTTDSNAWGPIQADGAPLHCSRGGWQCIPDTFAHYHQAGTSYRIYDGTACCAASMNYIMDRYGVARDGHNLAALVEQADPFRRPMGY